MNTGVGDVHNLIWKIHAVEQGWAKESFLDTVSSERLPIAKDNCRQSKINEDKVLRLIHIIQRPGTTAEELLADPVSRKQIQDAIDDNHEHFHSLNLQLGYVYGRAHTRPPSDYQKELLPGARLPHIWLENEDRKISSLDLVDGSGFVLITPDRFTNMKRLDCDGTLVAIKQLNEDFNDVYGDWHKLIISVENAALLVRPDQHLVGTISSIEQVWMALVDFYGHGNS